MTTDTTRAVLAELARATVKFPTWPTDPLHALGVLHEEVGELSKEVLQLVYEPHKTSAAKVRTEAIQAAAMALRFAMSLDTYEYTPGPQHAQEAAPPADLSTCDYPTTAARRPVCGAKATHTAIPWGEAAPVGVCDDHRIQGEDGGVLLDVRPFGSSASSTEPRA